MIIALALLALALAAVVVGLVVSQQAASDYSRATLCGSLNAVGNNCFQDVPATISTVTLSADESATGRLSGIYTLGITHGEDQWTTQISQRVLLRIPTVGQPITARIWRGIVTQLTMDGRTSQTLAAPSNGNGWGPWVLAVMLAVGSLGVGSAAWLEFRRNGSAAA